MTVIAATGHRPHKLGGHGPRVHKALVKLACEVLQEQQPRRVISGMALGWDQAWAEAAIAVGVPFIAAIPFHGQEMTWPREAQVHYHRLLRDAAETVTVSDRWAIRLGAAIEKRDRWMVDNCDRVTALFDGTEDGGTYNTIRYAEKVGRPINNLWARWQSRLRADLWELVG